MKFRKKSGIAQNQEKSGIIRKIRKCLTDCIIFISNRTWSYFAIRDPSSEVKIGAQ